MKKRIYGAALAVGLALSLTAPSFAQTVTRPLTDPDSGKPLLQDPGTVIGIVETDVKVSNISVEMPLYVTIAAMQGQADALVPNGYSIRNTSSKDDIPYGIAVTGVTFQKLSNTWDFVPNDPTDVNNQGQAIRLAVGGLLAVDFDALTSQKSYGLSGDGVDPGTGVIDNCPNPNCAFVETTGGNTKFLAIPSLDPTNTQANVKTVWMKNGLQVPAGTTDAVAVDVENNALVVPIEGKVVASPAAGRTASNQTSALVKVMYTVSALDANNVPVGNVYVGDIYGPGLGVGAGYDKGQWWNGL